MTSHIDVTPIHLIKTSDNLRVIRIITVMLLMVLQAYGGICQSKPPDYTLSASIVDSTSQEALPFATVYNLTQRIGTATNDAGSFDLPQCSLGDTVIVSYIGYNDRYIVISDDLTSTIYLSPAPRSLGEVVITAKSDYLVQMVANLRKRKRTAAKTAKTYFFLETEIEHQSVEIIEAHYNGKYADLGVENLDLKKGRIGLKPFVDRYYLSTESARLFCMHQLFDRSQLFPHNPLSVKPRKLKDTYNFTLNSTYKDSQSTIYVIDFTPIRDQDRLFSGRLWIDRSANRLIKVNLRIQDASKHPFIAIGHNTIEAVSMEITKSFGTSNDKQYISDIDFNYDVTYADVYGRTVEAKTTAFTKAYNYGQRFTLPRFEYTRHLHEDYRNITATPYDSTYWRTCTEFRFYDRLDEIEDFILRNKIDNNFINPTQGDEEEVQQLQFAYIGWKPERCTMSQPTPKSIKRANATSVFESDRFNFNVKLYLDTNEASDSTTYQAFAILDPIGSYYYFPISHHDLAFMNMHLDLMEIQCRLMTAELSMYHNPSEELIDEIYNKYVESYTDSSLRFVHESNRGRNRRRMKHWNRHIREALGVDNLALYPSHSTDD